MAISKAFIINASETKLVTTVAATGAVLTAIDDIEFFVASGSRLKVGSGNTELVNTTLYKQINSANSGTVFYFDWASSGDQKIDTAVIDLFRGVDLPEGNGGSQASGATTGDNWDTSDASNTTTTFIDWLADQTAGSSWTHTDEAPTHDVAWTMEMDALDAQGNPQIILTANDPAEDAADILLTRGNILKWNNEPFQTEDFFYSTKMIDFGNPATRKNIKRVDITFKIGQNIDSNVQVVMTVLKKEGRQDIAFKDTGSGSYNYNAAKGLHLEAADGDAAKELIAKIKPLTNANNVYACQIKFGAFDGGTIPAGFQIEDITIVYKEKHA